MTTAVQCKEIFGSYSNLEEDKTGLCPEEPCVPCQSKELCPPCPFRLTAGEYYPLKSPQNKSFFEPLYSLQNKCIEKNFKHKFGNRNFAENLKWRCKSKSQIKQKSLEKFSSGCPFGVCFGNLNLSQLKFEQTKRYNNLFGFGACILAFGELYITAEKLWDSVIINRILENGKKLVENSLCLGEFLTEINVNRRFLLCGNTMEVHLSEPIIIGRLLSKDIRIWNLRNSIKNFLRKYQHCLLTVGEYYFLIWMNEGAIFIFDPYGRDIVLTQNQHSGYASLICVGKFKTLEYLIVEMSDFDYDEVFTLRALKMTELIPCCNRVDDTEHQIRTKEYLILNTHHACLRSHINVESKIFKEFRFKHSLAIVITAIIYSKIDASNTWDSNILDKVIMIGNRFYKDWTNHKYDLIFTHENVPQNLKIGQFLVELTFCSMIENGLWKTVPNYRRTELTMSIEKCFQISSNLILQIQNKNYALWKRANAYYIFDPYAHDCINKDHFNVATLHMCNTIDMLCCVLSQQVIEIMDTAPYCIHIMFIRQIIKGNNLEQLQKQKQFEKRAVNEFQEILSLNESITEEKCIKFDYKAENIQEKESVIDLDSPTLSKTQIVSNYKEIKSKMGIKDSMHLEDSDIDIEEEEEEEKEEDDDEEEEYIQKEDKDDEDKSFYIPSVRTKKPLKKLKKRDVKKSKKSYPGNNKKTEKRDKGKYVKQDKTESSKKRKKIKKKSKYENEISKSRSEDSVPTIKSKSKRKKDKKTKKKMKKMEKVQDEDETNINLIKEKTVKKRKAKNEEKSEDSDESKASRIKGDFKKIVKIDEIKKSKSKKTSKTEKRRMISVETSTESADESTIKRKEKLESSEASSRHKSKTISEIKTKSTDSDISITSTEVVNDFQPDDGKISKASKIRLDRNKSDHSIENQDKKNLEKNVETSIKSELSEEDKLKSIKTEKSTNSYKTIKSNKLSLEQYEVSTESFRDEKSLTLISARGSDEDEEIYKPNSYPGYSSKPYKMALICTDADNEANLLEIFQNAFSNVDRIMIMTNQKNYVIFKIRNSYFLYAGCTCSIETFKHIDISMGTANLIYYKNINAITDYILENSLKYKKLNVDDICKEYCERYFSNSNDSANGNWIKSYNGSKLKFDNTKSLLGTQKNVISLHCKNYNASSSQNRQYDKNSYCRNFGKEHKIKINFKNVVKDICGIFDNAFKQTSSSLI